MVLSTKTFEVNKIMDEPITKKKDSSNFLLIIVGIAFVLIAFNSYTLYGLSKSSSGVGVVGSSESGLITGRATASIIPTGSPKVYGAELGVSYDDVSANDPNAADLAIETLGDLDNTITLNQDQMKRYINILYKKDGGIGCEYCCGAKSVIFENGKPACGCAHSYAMRGLAKYLITKHGDEYTDEEILEEVSKWKMLFFPTQMSQKAEVLKSKGIETSYTNVASNKYRGIESGSAGGGTVGGC